MAKYNTQQIRIIGGTLRGRKIQFPQVTGLRPSADRIRETLFNWLADDIIGASCLDLFAGSGALGFEALSRGAKQVCFVDNNAEVCAALYHHAEIFHTSASSQIMQHEALASLIQFKVPFDIIFLDPPFASDLLTQSFHKLMEVGLIDSQTKIYFETDQADIIRHLPCHIYRHKKAGKIYYGIITA